jgi:hypothetical protein
LARDERPVLLAERTHHHPPEHFVASHHEIREPTRAHHSRNLTGFIARRRGWKSIRTPLRLTQSIIVVVMVVLVAGLGWYAVVPRLILHVIAVGVQQVSLPAVQAMSALETERQSAMAYLSDPTPAAESALLQHEKASTGRLGTMQAAAGDAMAGAPASIVTKMNTFVSAVGGLDQERSAIAAGGATGGQVAGFYNGLLDDATALFDAQARATPDPGLAESAIAAVNVFRDSDFQSRAASLIASALAAQQWSANDYATAWNLIGAYHSDLRIQQPYLLPAVQQEYARDASSPAFQQLTQAETLLTEQGPQDATQTRPARTGTEPNHTETDPFPMSGAAWSAMATTVSQRLIGLATDQAGGTAAQGVTDSSSALTAAWWLIGVTISILLGLAILAWRLPGRLARRVRQLAADATTLDTQVAPAIVERLRSGEDIDDDTIADAVTVHLDGHDEISTLGTQLARSTADALRVTRELTAAQRGWIHMLVGYARRIQAPVEEQFTVLAKLQHEAKDPGVLAELYGLDKLATTVRRFLTGLFVLTGQGVPVPHDPMLLEEVITAAVHQTSRPEWFSREGSPQDLALTPRAAVLAVHLLTEIAENAIAVSATESPARIRAQRTAHGVAVEVDDLGKGLVPEDFTRFNAMMDDPPHLADMATDTRSARHTGAARSLLRLGLFTAATYAREGGMGVRFSESPWNGVRVVVTIPEEAIITPTTLTPAAPSRELRSSARVRPPTATAAAHPVSLTQGATPTALSPASAGAPMPAMVTPWTGNDPITTADTDTGCVDASGADTRSRGLAAPNTPSHEQQAAGSGRHAVVAGTGAGDLPGNPAGTPSAPTAAEPLLPTLPQRIPGAKLPSTAASGSPSAGRQDQQTSPRQSVATSLQQLGGFTQGLRRATAAPDITDPLHDTTQSETTQSEPVQWPGPDDGEATK